MRAVKMDDVDILDRVKIRTALLVSYDSIMTVGIDDASVQEVILHGEKRKELSQSRATLSRADSPARGF